MPCLFNFVIARRLHSPSLPPPARAELRLPTTCPLGALARYLYFEFNSSMGAKGCLHFELASMKVKITSFHGSKRLPMEAGFCPIEVGFSPIEVGFTSEFYGRGKQSQSGPLGYYPMYVALWSQ